MSQLQLSRAEVRQVYNAVSPNRDTHSLSTTRHGELMTQCGTLVVSATGYVHPGWEVGYPGNPAGTSWKCRGCRF